MKCEHGVLPAECSVCLHAEAAPAEAIQQAEEPLCVICDSPICYPSANGKYYCLQDRPSWQEEEIEVSSQPKPESPQAAQEEEVSYSCIDFGDSICDGCCKPGHKQGGMFATENPKAAIAHNKKLKVPLKLAHWKRGRKKVSAMTSDKSPARSETKMDAKERVPLDFSLGGPICDICDQPLCLYCGFCRVAHRAKDGVGVSQATGEVFCESYVPARLSQPGGERAERPKPVKLWASGGVNNYSDYLMSDESICTIHVPTGEIVSVVWQKGSIRPKPEASPAFEEWKQSEEGRYMIHKALPEDAARSAWNAATQQAQPIAGSELHAPTIEAAVTRILEQRCERGTPWDLAVMECAEALRRLGRGERREHETQAQLKQSQPVIEAPYNPELDNMDDPPSMEGSYRPEFANKIVSDPINNRVLERIASADVCSVGERVLMAKELLERRKAQPLIEPMVSDAEIAQLINNINDFDGVHEVVECLKELQQFRKAQQERLK